MTPRRVLIVAGGSSVSALPVICELGLAPLTLGAWDFGRPLTYAFHMNALKFADMDFLMKPFAKSSPR